MGALRRDDLTLLSAADAAGAIRAGRITSEALVAACLARIDETEPDLRAWAYLDAEAVLEQGRELDRIRKAGRGVGALHGVPVGVKDIVETADMPTECGSPIFAARQTGSDARIVEKLREAGAVIMGKTKTTEFAFMHPTDTTNPHNPAHSPGGSSSGSAAAVAARHVPLSVGSQTGGSVIRPASFCGVYGFKPTYGTISRTGVFRTSVTLDHIGGFARSIEDIALLTSVMAGYDQTDPASFPRPRADFIGGAHAEAPMEPALAWFDMPFHDRLDSDAAQGLDEVIAALGARVERMPPSPQLADLARLQGTIHNREISDNIAPLAANHWDDLSAEMQAAVERGRAVSETEYQDALAVRTSAQEFFAGFFNDFDAIVAPSAAGEAPQISAGHTGDAIFCKAWTLAGLPCLSLPILVGTRGLPIGVQLIGAAEEDDRLLRTAGWMQRALSQDETAEE